MVFNYTPNSHDIGVHFANIIVTKILFTSAYSNCIADDGNMIELEWGTFQEDYKESLLNSEIENDPATELYDRELKSENDILKKNAISYYAGYCAFKKINCNECKSKLVKNNEEIATPSDILISEKNYNKSTNFGALKAPTTEYFNVTGVIVSIFENMFKTECHLSNICLKITEKCLTIIELEYPGFLPLRNEPCFEHLKTLINFFVTVLTRKNSKWSVLKGDFKNYKHKNKVGQTQASKKLKILNG